MTDAPTPPAAPPASDARGRGGASGVPFPPGFLWGAATSAYQVEGAPYADGAGASIWDRFTREPGRIADGTTGDVACDHYHRMPADVALMADLGLRAYRFSVAWSRVLPNGAGPVNEAGLAFYDRLVDRLLEAGIAPSLTLYHWDLPAALGDRGGWLDRDTAARFAEYAAVVARRLGDRVRQIATLNEPWVSSALGYLLGVHAPGHQSPADAALAAHVLLLAHGAGVQAVRAECDADVGLVVNLGPQHPASDAPEDRGAADREDAFLNRLFLDPASGRGYPDVLVEAFGDAWPEVRPGDLEQIAQPLDFLGVNYYMRAVRAADPDGFLGAREVEVPGARRTAMGWEVYPDGLREIVDWAWERYRTPITITENGAAFDDPAPEGGRVRDADRVDYFHRHLLALRQAIADGADVRGYFAWSLLDNFEWAEGFAKRFGIVHVDYDTQARTPKDSARFFAEVIETNGASLAEPSAHDPRPAPNAPPPS